MCVPTAHLDTDAAADAELLGNPRNLGRGGDLNAQLAWHGIVKSSYMRMCSLCHTNLDHWAALFAFLAALFGLASDDGAVLGNPHRQHCLNQTCLH